MQHSAQLESPDSYKAFGATQKRLSRQEPRQEFLTSMDEEVSFKGMSGKKSAFDNLSFSKIADEPKTHSFFGSRVSPINIPSQATLPAYARRELLSTTASEAIRSRLFRLPDPRPALSPATSCSANAFYATTAASALRGKQTNFAGSAASFASCGSRRANVSAVTQYSSNQS